MAYSYRIDKPMLINRQIWCRITKINRWKGILYSAWKVYDIDKRSYSFLGLIPINFVPDNEHMLSDSIALNGNIYFYDGNGNLVEFNATTCKYSKSVAPITSKLDVSLSNLAYINERRLVQDSKTGCWYSHCLVRKWIYCCSGNMIKKIRHSEYFKGDKFVFKEDEDERKFNGDFVTLQIAQNALAYDDYLFYFESPRKIFILDFLNGVFCDIDLARFGIHATQKRCNGIIIEQYSSMLKMILLWFMIENRASDIDIPTDVYFLIELYHGSYYNLRLHLFDQCIHDEQKLDSHSYHTSISLGVVINAYSQNVDILRKLQEKYVNDDETEEALSEWEDY